MLTSEDKKEDPHGECNRRSVLRDTKGEKCGEKKSIGEAPGEASKC